MTMNRQLGEEIKNSICEISGGVFGLDIEKYLSCNKREIYGVLINPEVRAFEPLFGDIPDALLSAMNEEFAVSRAGYKVDVGPQFDLHDVNADLFFLHKDLLREDPKLVDALVLHELCHMVIDSGCLSECNVKVGKRDKEQGEKLFDKTDKDWSYQTQHDLEFCQLLSAVADKLRRIDSRFRSRWDVLNHAMKFDFWDI